MASVKPTPWDGLAQTHVRSAPGLQPRVSSCSGDVAGITSSTTPAEPAPAPLLRSDGAPSTTAASRKGKQKYNCIASASPVPFLTCTSSPGSPYSTLSVSAKPLTLVHSIKQNKKAPHPWGATEAINVSIQAETCDFKARRDACLLLANTSLFWLLSPYNVLFTTAEKPQQPTTRVRNRMFFHLRSQTKTRDREQTRGELPAPAASSGRRFLTLTQPSTPTLR